MALKEDLPLLIEDIRAGAETTAHNEILFNIFEGELLPYILEDLRAQLSKRSYDQVVHRVAPINVLKRIVDKLSRIYAKSPLRMPEGGVAQDTEMLTAYFETMQPNTYFGLGNEFFNLFKNTFVMPYLDRGKGKIRVVPSNLFRVYSTDRVNPLRVTHYTQSMGTVKAEKAYGNQYGTKTASYQKNIFHAYTDDEFLVVDGDGKVVESEMNRLESDGSNPYGKIPGVYVNRSRHCLIPKCDSDTLCMTKLLPVILSDVNFAVMMQAFSIIYGINVTSEDLKLAPNAFWELKSDPSITTDPKVGIIKPEVDSDKVLSLIKAQLQMWLQSRNIKPGAMGDVTVENMASGVSKVLDEMDTSEDRQKQVPFFQDAEAEFWDLLINHMHPVWLATGETKFTREFSKGFSVKVIFAEQRPIVDTSKVIADERSKLDAGLTYRKAAITALNPDATPEQIDEIMREIDAERTVEIESTVEAKENVGVAGNGEEDSGERENVDNAT